MSDVTIPEPNQLHSAFDQRGDVHRICQLPDKGWERWWTWATERINPIVVKEVRQSLKSRQFSISFGLTLLAAVAWTLIAISLMVPRVYYIPGGAPLLVGFFCILQVPLMFIIPLNAFHSLGREIEDSTFELLSISALSAWQIILGKMTTALLQILLYLSALAPCIVLTYLLRGISLFSILFLLGLIVVFSIAETTLALLLAAVSRTKLMQGGSTVLLMVGLCVAYVGWTSLLFSGMIDEVGNPPESVYVACFVFATIIAVLIELLLRAAAAAIDFPSENHSTPLRKRLLLLVSLVLFWTTFALVATREVEAGYVLIFLAFFVCMFVGALMTGERGIISPRACRKLPQTFFGRVMLTWFFPGAGMGYIFLVCMFAALYICTSLTELYFSSTMQLLYRQSQLAYLGYALLCYLVIYVGMNRLLMLAASRQMQSPMLGAFALMVVILVLLHLLPLITVFYLNDYREFAYDWHQSLNIYWSCLTLAEQGVAGFELSMVLITLAAIVIFGLNLLLSTRDVMLVRVAEPPRVQLDTPAAEPAKVIDPFAD